MTQQTTKMTNATMAAKKRSFANVSKLSCWQQFRAIVLLAFLTSKNPSWSRLTIRGLFKVAVLKSSRRLVQNLWRRIRSKSKNTLMSPISELNRIFETSKSPYFARKKETSTRSRPEPDAIRDSNSNRNI